MKPTGKQVIRVSSWAVVAWRTATSLARVYNERRVFQASLLSGITRSPALVLLLQTLNVFSRVT
jgi:hypothetical protein